MEFSVYNIPSPNHRIIKDTPSEKCEREREREREIFFCELNKREMAIGALEMKLLRGWLSFSLIVRTSDDFQIRTRVSRTPDFFLSLSEKNRSHNHRKGVLGGFASRMRNGPAERRIWVRPSISMTQSPPHHSHHHHSHHHPLTTTKTQALVLVFLVRCRVQAAYDTENKTTMIHNAAVHVVEALAFGREYYHGAKGAGCELLHFCERGVVRVRRHAYVTKVNLSNDTIHKYKALSTPHKDNPLHQTQY